LCRRLSILSQQVRSDRTLGAAAVPSIRTAGIVGIRPELLLAPQSPQQALGFKLRPWPRERAFRDGLPLLHHEPSLGVHQHCALFLLSLRGAALLSLSIGAANVFAAADTNLFLEPDGEVRIKIHSRIALLTHQSHAVLCAGEF
jgi:hypothetical protein